MSSKDPENRSVGRCGPRTRRGLVGAALVGTLFAVAPGWASPTWAATSVGHKRHHPAPRHKLGPLSGKWTGTYSGSYSGTFTLSWQETGQSLSGTIDISGFGNSSTPIHGVLKGSSITFGTVGSQAITYSGSVSGTSMSGTWKIQAGGQTMGGGSWSASKSH